MEKNKFEIDMCNGPIMSKLISFSVPLILSGMLQLMFNAVDIIVVGQFSGSTSLAAVGCSTGEYGLDCCMVDATVADMIIQYAVMGEIVYG